MIKRTKEGYKVVSEKGRNMGLYKTLKDAKTQMINVDAIAVTVGPGLGIALGVGINKAKDLNSITIPSSGAMLIFWSEHNCWLKG